MKEGDEWKAAFQTNWGLFEPTVMFFGLTNSPATFQAMMDHIFHNLISQGKVLVYIDDIVIHTKDKDEHRQITWQVLELLCENKLYVKPEKCEIKKSEIEYLGLIVSEGKIWMDPVKTNAIRGWPIPIKLKELQSFLGFCNFYRCFIKDYSVIVKLLTSLTGKVPWQWEVPQQEAFNCLKTAIMSQPILAIPIDNAPYQLKTDSLDYALGVVLSQFQDDKWHPVTFLSKSFNDAECNYEIYDKELLAIMTALNEWHHLLLGTTLMFKIWMDHQNLMYFKQSQKLNRRKPIGSLNYRNTTSHYTINRARLTSRLTSSWDNRTIKGGKTTTKISLFSNLSGSKPWKLKSMPRIKILFNTFKNQWRNPNMWIGQ